MSKLLEKKEDHHIVPLFTGNDSLTSRTLLLREAKENCDIMTFLWRNDSCGNFYLEECQKAAARGVRIRLLIDFWAPGTTKNSILTKMLELSEQELLLEIKLFNPVTNTIAPTDGELLVNGIAGFKKHNRRMHGKLQIIDGAAGIVGGRNIGDEYFDAHEVRSFLDFEVLYQGPEVEAMKRSFNTFWEDDNSVDLKALKTNSKFPEISLFDSEEAISEGGELTTAFKENINNPDLFWENLLQKSYAPDNVEFVNDSPNVNAQQPVSSGKKAEELLQGAEREVCISTPYLIPPQKLIDTLAQKEALKFSICTNSLITADNLYTYAAGMRMRDSLFKKLKVNMYELKDEPEDLKTFISTCNELTQRREGRRSEPKSGFGSNKYETSKLHCTLHAKYFIIDRFRSCIGAMNLDSRSLYHNTETILVIDDKDFAEKMIERHKMIEKAKNSWVIAPVEQTTSDEALKNVASLIDLENLKEKWVPLKTHSFTTEEKKLKEEVPSIEREDFYDKYTSAGMFPGVDESDTDTQVFLYKQLSRAFGELL